MSRTVIAATQSPDIRKLPLTALSADVVPATSDATNFNSSPMGGVNCLLVVQNTDASPHHIVIHSVGVGELNRTGDIPSYTVAASGISTFPIPVKGFADASGNLNYDTDNTLLKCSLVQLPAGF